MYVSGSGINVCLYCLEMKLWQRIWGHCLPYLNPTAYFLILN